MTSFAEIFSVNNGISGLNTNIFFVLMWTCQFSVYYISKKSNQMVYFSFQFKDTKGVSAWLLS